MKTGLISLLYKNFLNPSLQRARAPAASPRQLLARGAGGRGRGHTSMMSRGGPASSRRLEPKSRGSKRRSAERAGASRRPRAGGAHGGGARGAQRTDKRHGGRGPPDEGGLAPALNAVVEALLPNPARRARRAAHAQPRRARQRRRWAPLRAARRRGGRRGTWTAPPPSQPRAARGLL
jgi:hypothetical protein